VLISMVVAANKAKLTKSYVDSRRAPGFYWDSALTGFGLRISGSTKTYIVQARVNGVDRRRSIGRHGVFTPEQARLRAQKALHEMASGIDPKEADKARLVAGITLHNAFQDYLRRSQLKPRTEQDYRGYMERYFNDWAGKPVVAIKADMVEARHQKLLAERGGAQADVAMRFLRAVFNFASGKYQREDGEPLIAVNPVKRLSAAKLWAKPRPRERYVEEAKLGAWFKAVNELSGRREDDAETIRDYLLVLLFTGLRRTEAMTLRWEHVDLKARKFVVPAENTKNSTSHALPLTSVTLGILERRAAARVNDFVFAGRGRHGHLVEPKRAIARVTEMAGIEFTPHDLRRTFATCASTVIDNQSTVKRLMNHRTASQDITEGYKQGVERLREPSQRVTDYMLRLIKNGGPGQSD
jgi:integrase